MVSLLSFHKLSDSFLEGIVKHGLRLERLVRRNQTSKKELDINIYLEDDIFINNSELCD